MASPSGVPQWVLSPDKLQTTCLLHSRKRGEVCMCHITAQFACVCNCNWRERKMVAGERCSLLLFGRITYVCRCALVMWLVMWVQYACFFPHISAWMNGRDRMWATGIVGRGENA